VFLIRRTPGRRPATPSRRFLHLREVRRNSAAPSTFNLPRDWEPAGGPRRRGVGLIVVMVLVSVMAIYVLANTSALSRLRSHLKLIEKQQLERWAAEALRR